MTAVRAPLPFSDTSRVPADAPSPDALAASRHGATWTPQRLAALERGLADGLSCGRIAQQIGVSRSAVIGKLNRMGMGRGRTPTATITRTLRPRTDGAPVLREPRPHRPPSQAMMLRVVRRDEVEAPLTAGAEACTLFDLAPGKCRWPMGEDASLTFCGRSSLGSMSYCAGHARLAYRPSARRAG
jgi:GcrA cell cycle regulator